MQRPFSLLYEQLQCLQAKRTHVDCSEIEKFEGGEDSNKTVDDTTCTECKDGSYKFRPTSCKTKKKNCKNSETFTAGSDAEKTRVCVLGYIYLKRPGYVCLVYFGLFFFLGGLTFVLFCLVGAQIHDDLMI